MKTWESWRRISIAPLLRFWNTSGVVVGQRGFEGLISLDPLKVWRSCVTFPLRRGLIEGVKEKIKEIILEEAKENDEELEGLYDPVFIMHLLSGVLQDAEKNRLTGLDWVEVLRSNVLGLAVCGLISRDEGVRGLSGWCLKKTMEIISVSPCFTLRSPILEWQITSFEDKSRLGVRPNLKASFP